VLRLVERYGLPLADLELGSVHLREHRAALVEVLAEDLLQAVIAQALDERGVLQRLSENVSWGPAALQLDHNCVALPVEREQVDGGPEVRRDLPPDDEQLLALDDPVGVLLQPVLQELLPVLGLEVVLDELVVVGDAEEPHVNPRDGGGSHDTPRRQHRTCGRGARTRPRTNRRPRSSGAEDGQLGSTRP